MPASDLLFEPVTIGALDLPNRLVMAPMTRRCAPDDRVPTPEMAAYYERRAAGGVGLIITEGMHIDDLHAPDSERVPGIYRDDHVQGWRRVTDAVHGAGSRIAAQLWHTGRLAMRPIGPSAVAAKHRDGTLRTLPRAMDAHDMPQVLHAFARAARFARDAGFDAAEVHGAHGYLLDSFLSPEANQREDEYGGAFEQRMRFPLEVVRAVREAVGPDFPLLYRFSQWRVDDAAALCYRDPQTLGIFVAALREAGVDLLHASTRDATEAAWPEQSSRTLAGWARELAGLPVIAVGCVGVDAGMDEGDVAKPADPAPAIALLERGEADLLAVGRALISNPDWPQLVREGRWSEARAYSRAQLAELR